MAAKSSAPYPKATPYLHKPWTPAPPRQKYAGAPPPWPEEPHRDESPFRANARPYALVCAGKSYRCLAGNSLHPLTHKGQLTDMSQINLQGSNGDPIIFIGLKIRTRPGICRSASSANPINRFLTWRSHSHHWLGFMPTTKTGDFGAVQLIVRNIRHFHIQ